MLADDADGADLGECCSGVGWCVPAADREETGDGHRNDGIAVEALGRIADAQAGAARDGAAVGAFEAEQHAHECRLAGAVGADHSDDLARGEIEVDVFEDDAAGAREAQAARSEQHVGAAGERAGVSVVMVP